MTSSGEAPAQSEHQLTWREQEGGSRRQPKGPVPYPELDLTQQAGTTSPHGLRGFKAVFINTVKREEQLRTHAQPPDSKAREARGGSLWSTKMTAKTFLNQSYFIASYKYFSICPIFTIVK